jgi:hypothetical protein
MFGYILIKKQDFIERLEQGVIAQTLLEAKRKEYDDLWQRYHAHLTRKKIDAKGIMREKNGRFAKND